MKKMKGYIDLHLHLDGSISVKSARQLSEIEKIVLPEKDEDLKKMLICDEGCRNLNEYLDKFQLPCSLLQSEESIELAVYNLCKELEEKGYIYAEIRFAPQKHCEKGLTQDEVVKSAVCGLMRSGFFANLILCCMRDGSDNSKENIETAELTKKYLGKGVCALDLAGAEALFPNELYGYIFDRARQLDIPFTIHAGEALGAESVMVAIKYGAKRIGHGVRAYENKKVMEMAKELGVSFELCPTSNINTSIFRDVSMMPFEILESAGVNITINSDNMSVSDTDVILEMSKVKNAFNYSSEHMRRFLENSVRAAFLSDHEKKLLMEKL